jgi:pimeloyl-ACP methyl ester carboxylesterase
VSYLTTPDGVRLRVCDRGEGERTVVLVHGWKMSHRVFEHAILRLSREHRVVSFDLRGMGESDKPKSRYDFDELAGDLGFVVGELGLDDVTLVGWSMGCTVSLRYLERGGPGVGRLALINGPIRLARTTDDEFPWSMTEEVLEGYFGAIERDWPTQERGFTEESLHDPHPDLVDVIFRITQQTPLDVVLRVVREQAKLDFRAFLRELEIPVLAMYGRHDPYYPVELAEWIAAQCPRGEHVIFEESAHYPFIEEKDRFAEVIADFAARSSAQA